MKIPWSIATNAYQKGESQGHQVNAMNKIEYISFGEGDVKVQQDMLVVSVPFLLNCATTAGKWESRFLKRARLLEC